MFDSSSKPLPPLLAPDEPSAVQWLNEHGSSPFLLTCDHAGERIPRALADLGLPPVDRRRHIAWDIGVSGVTRRLSALLDACAVLQTYSRLVIDCNRPLGSPGSIACHSEDTTISGNLNVTPEERSQREQEVFRPYHGCIEDILAVRGRMLRPTVLIAMHSFTPVFRGVARRVHAGTLYNRDPRLARALLVRLREEKGLLIGDNEPYSASDDTDYAIPVYGERLQLLHVGIELRQDLLADDAGQAAWAERLARVLPRALSDVTTTT